MECSGPGYTIFFCRFHGVCVKPWNLHLFHRFLSYVGRMMASWLNGEEDLLLWSCCESWYQVDEIQLYPYHPDWYIYLRENHKNQPHVGKLYIIHGWYGICSMYFEIVFLIFFHGFDPMGFITVFHHHLGEWSLWDNWCYFDLHTQKPQKLVVLVK